MLGKRHQLLLSARWTHSQSARSELWPEHIQLLRLVRVRTAECKLRGSGMHGRTLFAESDSTGKTECSSFAWRLELRCSIGQEIYHWREDGARTAPRSAERIESLELLREPSDERYRQRILPGDPWRTTGRGRDSACSRH